MKVFISHEFGDNISKIINFLNEQDVQVFDSITDINYGESFQKATKRAISECDFVLLVYTSINPNIAFEAGIASSSNKPIFSIISDYKDNPEFLLDYPYVHALPDEIEKISFNLKIFLDKIKPKKKVIKNIATKYYGGANHIYYKSIYNNYLHINKTRKQDYESLFKDIFQMYSLNVIQNKFDYKSKNYADFCIWSDKLSNIIGNPILIEIKKEINKQNIKQVQNSIDKLINDSLAESCLIFYDSLNNLEKKDLPNTSKCLFIEISDFIEKLNSNDFNDSIRKIRNEIVHNLH